jgi:hypothetical protein
MSETEQVSVGEPMPRLARVVYHGAYEIAVGWAPERIDPEHLPSKADVVDLAPLILTHKLYKPLRDNPDLLETVHMIEDGSAIAWGADDAIDMAATSIERLAEEQMTSADFHAWLERHKLTYDAAAAQLGISRRLVAYYADQRPVPRYVALACRYISLRLTSRDGELAPKVLPEAMMEPLPQSAIKAGFRKTPSASDQVRTLIPKLSDTERAELIALLTR